MSAQSESRVPRARRCLQYRYTKGCRHVRMVKPAPVGAAITTFQNREIQQVAYFTAEKWRPEN